MQNGNDNHRSDNDQTESQGMDPTQEGEDTEGSREDESNKEGGEESNVLEWIVATIGALIVGVTFIYISVKIISGVGAPPDLQISLREVQDRGGELLIPVEVENKGGSVATDVTIEVCAGEQECAQLNFDYVPHESLRKGNVGFSKPLSSPLQTRVVSYREP